MTTRTQRAGQSRLSPLFRLELGRVERVSLDRSSESATSTNVSWRRVPTHPYNSVDPHPDVDLVRLADDVQDDRQSDTDDDGVLKWDHERERWIARDEG